jgi:S1-C subfamily serine protease
MARGISTLAVLAITTVLAAGCGGVEASAPPDEEPEITVPKLVEVSGNVPEASRVRIPRLAKNSAERRAERLTVRVRNVSCLGVGVGSGFAIERDVLVTNRHVLEGAERIEVSTWDGRTLQATAAEVGVLGDLGIARVQGTLPQVGAYGTPPKAGDAVTVVGYPGGGELTLSPGSVVDLVNDRSYGIEGRIMRLTSRVAPGSSGGPVLDSGGKIAGVVYAYELATDFALAIPVDTLRKLARAGGYEPVPPCGSG